ncbi:hypothetical protein [Roseateles koreensis]|uniref:Uncharacterized protein n=1 Tax=Roseateles koreensis TaxID=2987526 RepID=A0ABT5KTN8_9BURK|nr:hypothetical protein [Roseateles koreensis]MDC8786302.1 hypothetical protein [Roseateles koreensis]
MLIHMGRPWPMLDQGLVYGLDDGNRVDLAWADDLRFELSARIDARSEADQFLLVLLDVAATLDCGIYDAESMKPIDLTSSALSRALQASSAWRYALDPTSALRAS